MFIRRKDLSSIKTKGKVVISTVMFNKGEALAFIIRFKKRENVHEKSDADKRKYPSRCGRDIIFHSKFDSPQKL